MRGIPYFRSHLRDPGSIPGNVHIIAFYARFQATARISERSIPEDGMPPFHSIIVKRNLTN